MIEPKKQSIRKMLSKLNGNKVQFQRLLSVKRADALAQAPNKLMNRLKEIDAIEIISNEVIAENACTTLKDLAITGKDLITLGIPASKRIGEILNQLLEDVINENLANEKEVLLAEIQKYINLS
jgi:tRNA nucleotidyltransferase (CCA-adding enzyme)